MVSHKSTMQYVIWSSIVAQMVKKGDTHSQYYNKAFSKMKLHEPKENAHA